MCKGTLYIMSTIAHVEQVKSWRLEKTRSFQGCTGRAQGVPRSVMPSSSVVLYEYTCCCLLFKADRACSTKQDVQMDHGDGHYQVWVLA